MNSHLDNNLCYRVSYSRTLRLCSHRVDFEERVKLLTNSLTNRDYKFSRLRHNFCQVVSKYISEFLKWEIPINFGKWFNRINSNYNHGDSISGLVPFHGFSQMVGTNAGYTARTLTQ